MLEHILFWTAYGFIYYIVNFFWLTICLDCITMTLGDGICDHKLNSEICQYDYGDCCPDFPDTKEECYEIVVVGAMCGFVLIFRVSNFLGLNLIRTYIFLHLLKSKSLIMTSD